MRGFFDIGGGINIYKNDGGEMMGTKNRAAVWLIGVGIIVLVLANLTGYFLDIKYLSVFAAVRQADVYQIRSVQMMEAMDYTGVCDPEAAAKLWASGVRKRNAAIQYSVLSKELKVQYAEALETSFPGWVTGVSSPWIQSCEIIKSEKTDEGMFYIIKFYTMTSTGPGEEYIAEVTVEQAGDFWHITDVETDQGLYIYTGYTF